MSHTPEPPWHLESWQFSRFEDNRLCLILTEDEYNRARACVNACAGIPTSVLEAQTSGHLTASQIIAMRENYFIKLERDELKQQRDELLAALEKYGRHSPKGGDICSTILGNGNECDCGLAEAMANARGKHE